VIPSLACWKFVSDVTTMEWTSPGGVMLAEVTGLETNRKL
jgi:hypothetical protein